MQIHDWTFRRRRCDVSIVYECTTCSGFLYVLHGNRPDPKLFASSEDSDSPRYRLGCGDMTALRVIEV
jgi:hypothetical protein